MSDDTVTCPACQGAGVVPAGQQMDSFSGCEVCRERGVATQDTLASWYAERLNALDPRDRRSVAEQTDGLESRARLKHDPDSY